MSNLLIAYQTEIYSSAIIPCDLEIEEKNICF